MTSDQAIQTTRLGRIYRSRAHAGAPETQFAALSDVNLTVGRGELFGLLGPNGAGKSTLIKILVTLLSPTSGSARVAGFDVAREPRRVRPRINMVSGGESSGYGLLTVRENLWMFSQFYGIPSGVANRRIDELLAGVGLLDRKNTKSSELSTGLRQKMNIVRGFLTDPEVLFLDEPTLGLDVGASLYIRAFIQDWMRADPARTLLLTTHYMAEAEELCDRVAIINRGRVLACDTPANLKRELQSESVFQLEVSPIQGDAHGPLCAVPGVTRAGVHASEGRTLLDLILEREEALSGVLTCLSRMGSHLLSLRKREPTLEDVFIRLVGHSMEEAEHESGADPEA